MTARDDLAALINGGPLTENPRTVGGIYAIHEAYERADAIIGSGWVHDGSCRDCQANLSTNGGQHMFHCQTPEGQTQWADDEEDDQWPTATN